MSGQPALNRLPRIRRIARLVRAMSLLAMAAAVAGFVAFWSNAAWVQRVAAKEFAIGHAVQVDAASRTLAAAGHLPSLLLALLALWQLWRLFGCYQRGEVFSLRAVHHLQRLAQAVVAMAPVLPLSRSLVVLGLTWQNPPGQRILSFHIGSDHYLQLLLGLALLAMAMVMREAQRVADENAGFV